MRLSLKPSSKGERVRKVIYDEDLQNIIVHLAGNHWESYFNQTVTSSGGLSKTETTKEVRERDLAFLPLEDWGPEHWERAKQPYVFATGELVSEMKEAMNVLGLKEKIHAKYTTALEEVEAMDESNDDDIAAKLAQKLQLEKHEWKTLMEEADIKMKRVVDFGRGYLYCPSDNDLNSSRDDVSYADIATHV